MRGIAVLMVILFHAHALSASEANHIRFFEGGWSGVDMFFVLSGFLITGILRRTRGHARYLRTFAIRRVLRIIPVYYLVLLLIFTLPGFGADASAGTPFWVYPTFVSNFWVATSQTSLALVVTWSLSIEEQFYVFWPLVVRFSRLRTLTWICVGLVIAAPIFRFFLHEATNEIFYMSTPARMDSLAWGALAWIAWETRARRWQTHAARLAPWGMLGWAVVLALGGDDIRFNRAFAVVGLTAFPMIVASVVLGMASGGLDRWQRALEWKPLAHLGKVSFGAYLLHAPVIIALRRTNIDGHLFIGMIVSVIVTWTLASLMWRVVERPMLALKDQLAPY